MMTWRAGIRSVCLLCLILGGCLPVLDNGRDEEKDPYFLAGRNRLNSLDYGGAVESFSKALEANPRSASAHKELGLLYYQKLNDYAAAIYHFESLLRLRPNDPQAEFIRQNIVACKQELGRTVFLDPLSERNQRLLQRLTEENMRLKADITNLLQQMAVLRSAPASATSVPDRPEGNAMPSPFPTNATPPWPQAQSQQTPAPRLAPPSSGGAARNPQRALDSPRPPASSGTAPPSATSFTAHTIRRGETLSTLARRYGVSLRALNAANPGLDPRRLREGQVIKIPRR